jgi:hypothetical protein
VCVALQSPSKMHDANATSLRLWSLETVKQQTRAKRTAFVQRSGPDLPSSPPLFCARVRGRPRETNPPENIHSLPSTWPGAVAPPDLKWISTNLQRHQHTHKKSCLFEAEILGLHRAGSENNPYFQVYVRYLKLLRHPLLVS